eukprot:5096048-Pleurochrysis_carterae.AAC.5
MSASRHTSILPSKLLACAGRSVLVAPLRGGRRPRGALPRPQVMLLALVEARAATSVMRIRRERYTLCCISA